MEIIILCYLGRSNIAIKFLMIRRQEDQYKKKEM